MRRMPRRKCFTSLLQLELRAETAIAIAITNRQHMRVQVGLWISVCGIRSGFHARQRHGETNHGFRASLARGSGQIGIECTEYLAADFLRNQKCFAGNDVAVVIAPGLDLELNAGFQLVDARSTRGSRSWPGLRRLDFQICGRVDGRQFALGIGPESFEFGGRQFFKGARGSFLHLAESADEIADCSRAAPFQRRRRGADRDSRR